MSAESPSQQQQQTTAKQMTTMQQQQQQQPSSSQLWQDFGDVAVGVGSNVVGRLPTNTTTASSTSSASAAGTASQSTRNNNNNNNNYVDFNQFILQHDFLGNSSRINSTGNPSAAVLRNGTTTTSTAAAAATSAASNCGGLFGGHTFFNSSTSNGLDDYRQTSSNFFNTNSSSNLFPYNNDIASNNFNMNGSNGINMNGSNTINSNTINNSSSNNSNINNITYDNNSHTTKVTPTNLYDNLYTPFGNSSSSSSSNIGGTTYYANPFATGFDFGAVTSASNLHATAPEFVPRFTNLSLNETDGIDGNKSVGPSQIDKFHDNSNKIEAITLPNADYKHFGQKSTRNSINLNNMDNNLEASSSTDSSLKSKSSSGSLRGGQGLVSTSSGAIARSSGGSGSGSNANNKSTPNQNNQHSSSSSNNINNNHQSNYNSNNYNNQQQQRSDSRSSNGFTNGHDSNADKSASRERDQRRYQNGGRRSIDYHEREDRYERSERGGSSHGQRVNHRDRYDNHRSNKRRDDWNRNRDRINGYRVEEKYSSDNGKDSPLPSPEKKSPKKIYPENEKLSQREKLIRDIETRRLECAVCVEPIKVHHSVWTCSNCYLILHLQCISKWASSSKSDDGWRCPACQNVVKEVPRDYYCFCGKVKNPPYTRQDIAHSCGEVCGRVEGCAHACTLLCHPGPCPPCQANVKRECGCGKTTKVMQCCLKESIECDAICGKLLNCELHTCGDKCHAGKCQPCEEKVDQKCHCSKQERQVACTRDSHEKHTYSCGKPCGRDLTCGNHKCKDCCHAGECRPCKQSPEVVTSCPCGKMPVVQGQRTSCLDPIPVCEGVCSRTLRCGKAAHPHHCTSKCHLGNCPPCNKQTAIKCRCGHMDQMIKCRQLSTRADDARCKKRCVKKRSCGKHKCNQECCIDIDHICPLPCNYTLSCGKHKCDQPCHRGNCPPCYRSSFEELYCECGAEVIYPPVPCGTKRPVCKRPCSRSHPCDHTPQHNCHSAATCPPCMMFTTKWCFGQHEQRKTIPCSQESFSCGLACNKPLPCGRHKCIRSCHEGPCQQTQTEVCKQSCTALRPTCGHKCMAACHDGNCPETPCKEMVEVQCDCGNRKQMRSCHDLAREYSRIATAQLASSMAEMQRGNYMELSEILAPVKTNKTNKTLDCNEECRLVERNRRLAIGLQIRNPDLPQKLLTKYSDFIRNFAKRDPVLVRSIHDALTNLVKLAKESKQKSRSHSFPTMNREKRQLVHEMCEMFGVDSVAYDAEPNRNVVATAHKDRSWLPATSIIDVMQRESGQRRVPVPSNNAWGIKR